MKLFSMHPFASESIAFLRRKRQSAFSLVEVALSVGIVGFGMTVILGCLPVGLMSVKDSKTQSATANIARQLRGELQQIAWETTNAGERTIDNLAGQPVYYSQEGMPVASSSEAYFIAKFDVKPASVTGASVSGSSADTSFKVSSARDVTVNLEYPFTAPEANREKAKISLFVARQRGI